MSSKIEPCPFCHPHPACEEYPPYVTQEIADSGAWCIHAPCCDFYGPLSTSENDAIYKWNKRAAPVVERQPFGYVQGEAERFIGKTRYDRENGYTIPVYTTAPELAELQATVARLTAENERLCARLVERDELITVMLARLNKAQIFGYDRNVKALSASEEVKS